MSRGAAGGAIIFTSSLPVPNELLWVDREGNVTPVDPALQPDFYFDVALSPDDRSLAVAINDGPFPAVLGQVAQLWVKELPDGPMTQITNDPGRTRRPVWSEDGQSVTYITRDVTREGPGAWEARSVVADGSSPFAITLQRERAVMEVFYTPDAAGLVFREGSTGDADLGYLDHATDSVSEDLLATEFNEQAVSLSPDGRWMAYVSDLSGGQDEVYVRPFPFRAGRVQISVNGGTNPVWAHNGREIFFVDGDGWLSVASYQAEPDFDVVDRSRLFDASGYGQWSDDWRAFDVTQDDERFVMVRPVGALEEAPAPRFFLVQNFFEELKARVGGG